MSLTPEQAKRLRRATIAASSAVELANKKLNELLDAWPISENIPGNDDPNPILRGDVMHLELDTGEMIDCLEEFFKDIK